MVLDDYRAGATALGLSSRFATSREQAMRYFKARYIGPSLTTVALDKLIAVRNRSISIPAVRY